jgi:hypothetical protein
MHRTLAVSWEKDVGLGGKAPAILGIVVADRLAAQRAVRCIGLVALKLMEAGL